MINAKDIFTLLNDTYLIIRVPNKSLNTFYVIDKLTHITIINEKDILIKNFSYFTLPSNINYRKKRFLVLNELDKLNSYHLKCQDIQSIHLNEDIGIYKLGDPIFKNLINYYLFINNLYSLNTFPISWSKTNV